jgi:phosphatidylserine decarboxylase
MNEKLFIALQRIVPQHALSRALGWLAATENEKIKNRFISWFIKRYKVDMSLAIEEDPLAYENFNAFFTRAIKPELRPIDPSSVSVVCPADGSISQIGKIVEGRIFQAKGQEFSCIELLGGDENIAAEFNDGSFATVYLSPRDYHRVHMPYRGKLRTTVNIPGELFSVNTATANNVPRLFARNERLVAIFDTAIGPMAIVLVGAMIVAGIETVWDGQVAPFTKREIESSVYPYQNILLKKGDEMGRFKLGSTAIILFAKNRVRWNAEYKEGTPTLMGQGLGKILQVKQAT